MAIKSGTLYIDLKNKRYEGNEFDYKDYPELKEIYEKLKMTYGKNVNLQNLNIYDDESKFEQRNVVCSITSNNNRYYLNGSFAQDDGTSESARVMIFYPHMMAFE